LRTCDIDKLIYFALNMMYGGVAAAAAVTLNNGDDEFLKY